MMKHEIANDKQRYLSDNEFQIIVALIDASDNKWQYLKDGLRTIPVFDMNDGGMGSLIFYQNVFGNRKLGKTIINAEYMDKDNVPVLLALNLDHENRLFEIDFWKVNHSPRIHFPAPSELTFDR